MKRFGEKAAREAIANGAIIRAWDWYTLEAGYRVIIDGETAGYIVSDLFFKLKNDGTIVKDHWAHSYTDYKAAEEITTAEAAEMLTDALQMFERCGVISNLKVEPLTAKRASSDDQEAAQNAASDDQASTSTDGQAGSENPAEAEKTAQEWNEESDRVQAATLAALAPVIAAEEAAPAAEEAPAETPQEKTDRENWEHCKRIAEELEAYADGRVYRCPECGQNHCCDDLEPTEDGAGDTCCTCPSCGQHSSWTAWEELSLYDFFADCLDIEYRCGSDREYRSVCVMVACGGPNIYIDTDSKAVELYWWTDRARYHLRSDAVDAVDDWAREYWEL